MIRSVTEIIENHSGVLVPDYVKLRWESRSKGALASSSHGSLSRDSFSSCAEIEQLMKNALDGKS